MKILQINSVCGIGSTGKIAVDLYKTLKSQGHECKIAFGREKAVGIPAEDAILIGSKAGVYCHAAMSRLTDRTGFYSSAATKRLIQKIEEYNPDIIHLHNIHGYYINIEILFNYLAKANKKVVWTLHDCWAFTGHCAHFDYAGCGKWETACGDCPQISIYPKSFIDSSEKNYQRKKELFTSVKDMTIITPSMWLGNLVKQSFLSKYEVRVINNGIDLDVFKPSESDFRKKHGLENKIMLLAVANIWDDRKGFKDIIRLSGMLNDRYKIVIVGLSGSEVKNLPDNIIGIKRTNSQQELAQIYTAADIFINPTLEETLSLVNIESQACGTPVITYNTGGSPEGVYKFKGSVVKKGNVNKLLESILNTDPSRINKDDIFNKAREFDKNDRFNDYIDVYRGMRGE